MLQTDPPPGVWAAPKGDRLTELEASLQVGALPGPRGASLLCQRARKSLLGLPPSRDVVEGCESLSAAARCTSCRCLPGRPAASERHAKNTVAAPLLPGLLCVVPLLLLPGRAPWALCTRAACSSFRSTSQPGAAVAAAAAPGPVRLAATPPANAPPWHDAPPPPTHTHTCAGTPLSRPRSSL